MFRQINTSNKEDEENVILPRSPLPIVSTKLCEKVTMRYSVTWPPFVKAAQTFLIFLISSHTVRTTEHCGEFPIRTEVGTHRGVPTMSRWSNRTSFLKPFDVTFHIFCMQDKLGNLKWQITVRVYPQLEVKVPCHIYAAFPLQQEIV